MAKTPNVVLIVLDTVRADHLSCYGYRRKTTPNIDTIARRGVLYENAFTAAPWTPPSHASIFTGKYPSHHRTIGKDVRFKEENTSLAEILSRNGYHSIGIVYCEILGLRSGFEKGFQEFVELTAPSISEFNLQKFSAKDYIRTLVYGPDKCAYQATEVAEQFIEKKSTKKEPFFMFINYFDAHTPYDPPRPFKKKFCSNLGQSRIYMKELILDKLLGRTTENIAHGNMDIRKLRWIASGGGGFAFAAKQAKVSEPEWEVVRSWYDGEIAYLDYMIGNLVNFLSDMSILDDTLLIITSDHGENFGEHGLAVHPLCVYDSLLRVPLIMSHPDLIPTGKRINSLVSTVDILPTLTSLLNIKFDGTIQGKSLHPFEERQVHEFVCAEYGGLHTRGFQGLKAWKISSRVKNALEEVDTGCKCIRTLTYKYILTPQKEELYNIQDDPQENVNIVAKNPEIARALRKQLEGITDISYFGPDEFPHGDEKDKEMIKRLRTLGYI